MGMIKHALFNFNQTAHKKYDKILTILNLKYQPVEGVDFEQRSGNIIHTIEQILSLCDKQDQFDKQASQKYPVKFFFLRTIPSYVGGLFEYLSKLHRDIIRYITYKFIHKYHIVNTKLPPNYYDCDTRMVNAISSLIIDFIEIECDHMYKIYNDKENDLNNYGIQYMLDRIEDDAQHKIRIERIIDAFNFFKTEKAQKLQELDNLDINVKNFASKYNTLSNVLYDLETKHITNVIKYRYLLWT